MIFVCLKLGMVTTTTCLFSGPVGFGPVTTRLGDGALPPNLTQPKDGHPFVNSKKKSPNPIIYGL